MNFRYTIEDELHAIARKVTNEAKVGSVVAYNCKYAALPYYRALGEVIAIQNFKLQVDWFDKRISRCTEYMGEPLFYHAYLLEVVK